MYKRIYHDMQRGKIHLWEFIDGRTRKRVIDHPIEYYVPDDSGTSDIKDIFGNPVKKMISDDYFRMKEIRNTGLKLCESDIGETTKYLQKNYLGKDLKPDMSQWNVCDIDIEIESGNEFPHEDQAKYPINLITIWSSKTKQYYIFGNRPYTGDSPDAKNYVCIENEKEMLIKFMTFFKHCNFDIITGWNVWFDIKYITNRLHNIGVENMSFSPIDNVYVNNHGDMSIAGLIVLDYMQLYKEIDRTPQESYSLNSVSMNELGVGKLELEGQINVAYKTNWNRFVEYNINDVFLVRKLDEKKKLIELMINFAYQALIPVERAMSTIAVITGYILKYLHQNNMVLPDKPNVFKEEYPGAYNHSLPGVYENCISFDVESMYPHVLIGFNVSPETLVTDFDPTLDLIPTPIEGIYYRKDKKGVLPIITEMVFKERKIFKTKEKILNAHEQGMSIEDIAKTFHITVEDATKRIADMKAEGGTVVYYHMQQGVRKVIANSMYGVMGNPYFHLYSRDNAMTVTSGGQDLIKYLSNQINLYFIEKFHVEFKSKKINSEVVILVDTDSCYVCLNEVAKSLGVDVSTHEKLLKWQDSFNKEFFEPFFNQILQKYADKYGIKQLINFKREKTITKQIVLKNKRYVAEYISNEGIIYKEPQLTFVGVEVVRSGTPQYCRDHLKATIKTLFDTFDQKLLINKMIEIKDGFFKQPIDMIASPRGINNYNKYAQTSEYYIKNGLSYVKGCQIHIRAAINYNYITKKYGLPLQPAADGSKIKFIYTYENNEIATNVIGFIGKYPVEFTKIFKIDYESQWEASFIHTIQQFFDVLNWGKINLEQCAVDELLTW
jgi:DNA polymerase elongation subunit (family B)